MRFRCPECGHEAEKETLTPEEVEAVLRRLRGVGRMGDRHLLAHAESKLREATVSSGVTWNPGLSRKQVEKP